MNQLRHQLGTYQMISAAGGGFCRGGGFSQPISQLRNGRTALRSGTRVPKGGFTVAKHPSKWGRDCEIKKFPIWLCAVHLQNTITSSFQIQIVHRLKCWTPDFPRFETTYGIHNLSSMKCSKMRPTVTKWGAAATFQLIVCTVVFKRP